MAGAPVGNQNARKAKLWTDAVKRAISRRANGDLSGGLDTLADKLVIAAESGEQWAMLELGNRLDGKPAQAIVGGDEDDNPIQVSGVIKLTKPIPVNE